MKPADIQNRLVLVTIFSVLCFIMLPLLAIDGKYTGLSICILPFGIGYTLALLLSYKKEMRSPIRIVTISLVVFVLYVLGSLVAVGEGFICLLIYGLILFIPYKIGVFLGFLTQRYLWSKYLITLLLFTTLGMAFTTSVHYHAPQTREDEIIIHAPPHRIWNLLLHPVDFGTSSQFFFKRGVSYPTRMELVTSPESGVLRCTYTHGHIDAPLLALIPQHTLRFTLHDSLISMKEMNVHKQHQTMHIQHHVKIDYGEFQLDSISPQQCKLYARTRFRHKFEPEWYTRIWVSFFLKGIHSHVLNRIKIEAEK